MFSRNHTLPDKYQNVQRTRVFRMGSTRCEWWSPLHWANRSLLDFLRIGQRQRSAEISSSKSTCTSYNIENDEKLCHIKWKILYVCLRDMLRAVIAIIMEFLRTEESVWRRQCLRRRRACVRLHCVATPLIIHTETPHGNWDYKFFDLISTQHAPQCIACVPYRMTIAMTSLIPPHFTTPHVSKTLKLLDIHRGETLLTKERENALVLSASPVQGVAHYWTRNEPCWLLQTGSRNIQLVRNLSLFRD